MPRRKSSIKKTRADRKKHLRNLKIKQNLKKIIKKRLLKRVLKDCYYRYCQKALEHKLYYWLPSLGSNQESSAPEADDLPVNLLGKQIYFTPQNACFINRLE